MRSIVVCLLYVLWYHNFFNAGKISFPILPFVQRPTAADTEAGLSALLEKVEGIMGLRWKVTFDSRRIACLEN